MIFCDIAHWRAAIGNFNSCRLRKPVLKRHSPLSYLQQTASLVFLCAFFVLISMLAVPLTMLLLILFQLLPLSQNEPLNIFVDVYFHVKVLFCFPLSLLSKINYSLPSRTRKLYRSYWFSFLSYAYGFTLCEFANLLFLRMIFLGFPYYRHLIIIKNLMLSQFARPILTVRSIFQPMQLMLISLLLVVTNLLRIITQMMLSEEALVCSIKIRCHLNRGKILKYCKSH